MQKNAMIIASFVVFATAILIISYFSNINADLKVATLQIYGENGTVRISGPVHVAMTLAEKSKGLQNTVSFGKCGTRECIGMLFYFDSEQNVCMWMNDTYMPLRQVWFNSQGIVTYSYNATPLSDNVVCSNANYVLEAPPELDIVLGDYIKIK